MTFLASLLTHASPLYLSEAGTWLPMSAFGPKSPQRLRRFRHEQSALAIAREWAGQLNLARSERYEPRVEVVR